MRIVCLVLTCWSIGCGSAPKDEDTAAGGDTAPRAECPQSMEDFCRIEFGGPCPTLEEASEFECDGVHMNAEGVGYSATVGAPTEECDFARVSCFPDESDSETILFFSASTGVLMGVWLDWPGDDPCGGGYEFGNIGSC